MANVALNLFESYPVLNDLDFNTFSQAGWLQIYGVELPGSLSFNTPAVMLSQATSGATLTVSFGLYSLTGSTLSLANSASQSFNTSVNGGYWLTLVTSATQNITPGNWYFAFITSATQIRFSLLMNDSQPNINVASTGLGVFVRGYSINTLNSFPNSIATSDLNIDGSQAGFPSRNRYPYIIISS